jgi:arginyl-tRNA synthetase
VGIFHNYHVTKEAWEFPVKIKQTGIVFEGFSPNLNKELHIGHLKNLCIAVAITNITGAKPVGMLGAAVGVKEGALKKYEEWCDLAGYHPQVWLDKELPPPTVAMNEGTGEYAGCKVWNDVVIYKSNGSPTYAAHDLSFAELVKPNFYLTGEEQHEHFTSLGLGEKHIPMGLVLGKDLKKMKSTLKQEGETANLMTADELIAQLLSTIKATDHPQELVWNVVAWQFNSASVGKNTVLDVEGWCKITSPGIYITYTNARIGKALKLAQVPDASQMDDEDIKLCGFASYVNYYWQKAIDENEPSHVAQFALKLAKKLSEVYSKKSIKDGSAGFVYALTYATNVLQQCMKLLGMKVLDTI